jgi:collagen type III alpha
MVEPLSTLDVNADAEFVRSCLRATKRTVKLIEVGSAAMVLAAYTLLTLTAVVIADHLLAQGLSAEARRVARWAYLTGAVGIFAWLAVVPLVRRINDLFAAWVIEHQHPEFKNSLISALQLAWRGELPGSMRAALTTRAAGDLTLVDVRRTVDTRSARRAALVAAGAVLVFLIYAALAPKPIMPSIRRALGFELPPPTRTQIVIEEPPADYKTFVGSPVRMVARVEGKQPAEACVQFSLDGGSTWLADQRLALSPPPTGRTVDPREHRRWRAVKSGRDVQQTMHYQFVAGDGRSEVRLLRVCPYPSVAQVTVRYEYPPYTGLAAREAEGGNVDGIVGTLISVRMRTSVPADSPPTLAFRKTDRGTLRSFALDDSGQHFVGRFRIEADDEYTIDYQDQGGTRNADSVVYTVRARPDRPPLVELRQPDDNITLSASDSLELGCEASDDFGLTEAMLEYQIDERTGRVALAESLPAETRSLSIVKTIPLSRLDVSPGDRVTWWVGVKDNRCNVRNEPAHQSAESERRHIEVRQEASPRAGQRGLATTLPAGEGRQVEPQTSRPPAGRPGESGQSPSASTQRAVVPPAPGEATTRSGPAGSQPSETMEEFVRAHRHELELLKKHLADGHPEEGDRPESASQAPGAPQAAAEGREEGGQAANDQPDADRSADGSSGPAAGSKDQQAEGQRNQQQGSAGKREGLSKASSPSATESPRPTESGGPTSGMTTDTTQGDRPAGQQGPRGGPSEAKPDRSSPGPSEAKPDAGSPGAREQGTEGKGEGVPKATQPSTEGAQNPAEPAENKDGQYSSHDKATQTQPAQDRDRQGPSENTQKPAGKSDQSSEPSSAGQQSQPTEQAGQKDAGGRKQDQTGSPSREKGDAGSRGQEGEGENAPEGDEQGNRGTKGQSEEGKGQAQDQGAGQGQGDRQGKDGSQSQGQGGEPSDKSSPGDKTPPGAEGPSNQPGQKGSEGPAQGGSTQGESQTQGRPSAGQQQPQGAGGTPQQAEGDKAGPNSQTGGGAKDGIKGSGPVSSGPTTRGAVEYEVPETDAPDGGSSRLSTIDRTERLVNELERELRRGEPDPNMLKDLGWTPQEAQRFVREFRRAHRDSPTARISSGGVQEIIPSPASQPGDERFRTAAGRDAGIRTRDAVDRRDPDTIHRLLEIRRQQVGEEYRELLEEYYKTVAGRRTTTPGTQPGGR